MTRVAEVLRWSAWRPLRDAARDPTIPHLPGLYRIRRVGRTDLDYVGQTGVGLRQRLGMLRGIYAAEMPYRDPHTAAPALWALRHATGWDFEVSVAPVEGSTPWRKGLEAVAIALYRQEHGRSPTVEFGRMPAGYAPSSGNNARLVRLGLRVRGGPSEVIGASHAPGVPPTDPLTGDPQGERWGGHAWLPWLSLRDVARAAGAGGNGLYRIRGAGAGRLLYVGQGLIPARPLAHLAKTRTPDNAQGRVFAAQARLECSWVIDNSWLAHQRLELENDLIAAHLLATGEVPAAQFLG